ncbi:MAG: GNAT family N-acetyltransferase [Bauldia sp.]|nr:GNAT family N-acetyltransferase [Bauldia sp.]
MSVAIRAARAGDEAVILDLIRGLADYERLSHEVEATAGGLATALFSDRPRVFCDIAETDGTVAGFALWFYTFSTFRGRHGIYLEDLFVRPELRGRGAGKALLRRLARRCVDEGLGRFEWSVLDWNEPAVAFYRSQGARLLGDWTMCRIDGAALLALAGEDAAARGVGAIARRGNMR